MQWGTLGSRAWRALGLNLAITVFLVGCGALLAAEPADGHRGGRNGKASSSRTGSARAQEEPAADTIALQPVLVAGCTEGCAALHISGEPVFPSTDGGVASPVGTTYSVSHRIGADLDGGGPAGITCLYIFNPALPGAPDDVVTFNGLEESGRTDLLGTVPRVTETDVAQPGGRRLITIQTSAPTGRDLFPGGFVQGGVALSDACFAVGLEDPLTWAVDDLIQVATIDFLRDGQVILEGLEATGFFTNPWNGVASIILPGGAGQGFNGVRLRINVEKSIEVTNDDCRDQVQVADGVTPFTTIGSSTDGPDVPTGCDFGIDHDIQSDIWYRHTASCTGNLTVDLCNSSYDTRFAVYDGCRQCPVTGEILSCNDDFCGLRSFGTAPVVQEQCYTIRVGGYLGVQGNGSMNLSCSIVPPPSGACCSDIGSCLGTVTAEECGNQAGTWFEGGVCPGFSCPIPPPVNDECTDCSRVITGVPFHGHTSGGSGSQTSGCSDADTIDVWHCWTADCTGRVTITTCGSSFDTTLAVYDACGGVRLKCNDDDGFCPGVFDRSKVTVDVTEGRTYFIRVAGYQGATGNYTLNVGECENACCLSNGTCGNLTAAACQSINGSSPGPGTLCGGDLDGNGINDACETCTNATIAGASPADGTVDARQPHARNNLLPRQGIGAPGTQPGARREAIVIVLSPPVDDAADCFDVCETVVDSTLGPNFITSVIYHGLGVYEMVLHHAITRGGVTTIEYLGDGSSVEFIAHPGNVDGGPQAGPNDVLDHVECCLRGTCAPVWGGYSCDIDRSTKITPADTLFEVDLLNGTQNWEVWDGTALPSNSTCP